MRTVFYWRAILAMENEGSNFAKMPVIFQSTTLRHIPEDDNLQTH